MNEDYARQVLTAAGIAPRYINHGLSILCQPRNVGREEAIARLLKKTTPEWFVQKPRKPSRPTQPPAFVRGPKRHRRNANLKLWLGHTCVAYSNKPGSEQFARLASLQSQDVEGIEPELVNGELWLRAGGKRFFLLLSASPTQVSDVIYQCRMAIWQAENPTEKETR